jgi:hypothetical protein
VSQVLREGFESPYLWITSSMFDVRSVTTDFDTLR